MGYFNQINQKPVVAVVETVDLSRARPTWKACFYSQAVFL